MGASASKDMPQAFQGLDYFDDFDRQTAGKYDYDFTILTEIMIKETPAWNKKAIALTLSHLKEYYIDRKRSALRKRILKVALASAAAGAVPLPGTSLVDKALIMGEVQYYKQLFDLDDESLKRNARALDIAVEDLKENLNITRTLDVSSERSIATFVGTLAISQVTAKVTTFVVPVLGSIIAAVLSYGSTVSTLTHILNECVSDALVINRKLMQKMSE